MRRPLLLSLLVSLLPGLLVVPAEAGAYSISLLDGNKGNIVRWHVTDVGYFIYPSGSADVVDGSDIAAVQAGFEQWNAVSCSKMNFVYQGAATTKNNMATNGSSNGKNEVIWAEGSEWTHGQFVLGLTSTSFQVPSGEIVEADIAFNGYLNKWSTNGKSGTVDVLNVAAHEQGHFFGAQHALGGYSASNPPTMAPKADPYLKSQSIEADDKQCICFLYPKTEFNCSSDEDCPFVVDKNQFGEEAYVGKVTCQGGLCGGVSAQIPEGTKVLGEPCASDFDCKKPLFCQPTGVGESACAKKCNADSDCGSGFKCYPYNNAAGGVCLPFTDDGGGTGPGATKENGETCNYAQECKSGLCVGGSSGAAYCRQPCTLGTSDCPSTQDCAQLQGASYGACLPSQGGSGTKPPGAQCTSPAECVSGLCVSSGGASYFCRENCSPQLNDCPEDHACFQLVGSNGGACFPVDPKKELGDTCVYQNDCESDMCLGIQGQNGAFCSQACSGADGSCPCGMQCDSFVGGDKFCVIGGPTACTPSGNPCEGAAECISQSCISGICRDPCKVTEGGCPPGQSCRRNKAGSALGVCLDQGAGALGEPCQSDEDCQTLLCENGACEMPCDPATSFCGEGMACLQLPEATLTICADKPPEPGTDATDATDGPDGTDGPTGTDGTGGTAGTDGTGGAAGTEGNTPGGGSDGGNGGAQDGAAATGCQSSTGGSAPLLPMLILLSLVALAARRARRSTQIR